VGLWVETGPLYTEHHHLGLHRGPQDRVDRFAARTGFDPRALATPYRWFRISSRRIQA